MTPQNVLIRPFTLFINYTEFFKKKINSHKLEKNNSLGAVHIVRNAKIEVFGTPSTLRIRNPTIYFEFIWSVTYCKTFWKCYISLVMILFDMTIILNNDTVFLVI